MTFSKSFQTTYVNFPSLDANVSLVVEVLLIIGFELALAMEKNFPSLDVIFFNMK